MNNIIWLVFSDVENLNFEIILVYLTKKEIITGIEDKIYLIKSS